MTRLGWERRLFSTRKTLMGSISEIRGTVGTTGMKRLMTSCITILLLANLVHSRPQSPMSARQIIERMAEVYASCRTYSDEGEVSTEYVRIQSLQTVRQPFSTAFIRPASFRFEFSRRRGKEGWDR